MIKKIKFLYFFIFLVGNLIFPASILHANNLLLSNVSLESRDPNSETVIVEFDLSWDNAWNTKINHDAVWVTFRLDDGSVPKNKKLCEVTYAGLNSVGTSVGSNPALEIYVPDDKLGAFVRLANFGQHSSVASESLQVTIDYASCGFSSAEEVTATVFGLEMVLVPQGAFYAGDYANSSASLTQGSADDDPWYITNDHAISVSNPTANGYRYVSNNNIDEDATGSSFTLPSEFPLGYQGFYAMKYEITEGQWVEFVNSLPTNEARANRDITDGAHKSTDAVKFRNTVSCSGLPLTCTTTRPYRAASYLSWMDLAAFLDWAGLRPMSELEYEKLSRGAIQPVKGEFAWGSASITAATTISAGDEDGTEIVSPADANANFGNITFVGGDADSGGQNTQGALRAGIFAGSATNRQTSGASYYGAMELSGNVIERVVTVGNAAGRNFEATHGDGVLSTENGNEGNATNIDWPGIDATEANGVTGADGSGFKGGSWSEPSAERLKVSDRYDAANGSIVAFSDAGGRGVRTYDGD